MGVKKLLEKRKAFIDAALEEILPSEKTFPSKLHKALRYSVFSGGKRIRPILAVESCICCGGRLNDVKDAACALELVHTFSLIHDDLPAMDDDDYRRGKLTCHKKFDEATAILAGDALLSLAFEILARNKRPSVEARLVKELAHSIGTLGMAGGQSVDIDYGGIKKTKKVLNYINSRKTGALIKASLKMGAIASGAGTKQARAMEKFGAYIGEAFQIVDDILDNGDSVSVLGRKEAYGTVRGLTVKAKNVLKGFAGSAGPLFAIADCLIDRKV